MKQEQEVQWALGRVARGCVAFGLVDGGPSSLCCVAERIEGDRLETWFGERYEWFFEARVFVRIKIEDRVVLEIILSF